MEHLIQSEYEGQATQDVVMVGGLLPQQIEEPVLESLSVYGSSQWKYVQ